MTYFEEVQQLPDYPEADGDFRFSYNGNSGGGNSFLAGKYKDKDGQLTKPVTLEGKQGVFKYAFKIPRVGETTVILNSDDVVYEIKRRGGDSTSMKLEVGTEKPTPSKALTAFFMLPEGCGVRASANLTCRGQARTSDLTCSVLAKGNYWLQSMRLDCEEASQPNTVYLIPLDLVFSGGVEKDGDASSARYFRLDSDRRIRDIIAIAKKEVLPKSILEPLGLFADIYVGKRQFKYEDAERAAGTLMLETVRCYPALYSGIDDPLPALTAIALDRSDSPIKFQTGLGISDTRNIVIFGAPGTGKSKLLDQKKDTLLGDGGEFERVTFHPDYSYAHFVGTYKPVPTEGAEGRETITYKYVAGPFMRVLAAALRSGTTENPKPHLLLIEEINRASPSAVFGDVFQLLDRNGYNVSEYPIHASADVRNYLAETVGGQPSDYKELRIPDNMFIWGSMNSADQGVFPMDTAFKRRWNFVYIGINDSEADLVGKHVTLGHGDSAHTVQWNELRKSINDFLADKGINEDKQLGPFFLGREVAVPAEGNQIDREVFIAAFKQKVLMYLFEDAARQHRKALFEGCGPSANRYSDICRDFDRVGIDVFHRQISGRVLKTSNSRQENRDEAAPLGSRQE